MNRPPLGHNAQKRPDFKGFHGSIGPSGWAVKALFLYEVFDSSPGTMTAIRIHCPHLPFYNRTKWASPLQLPIPLTHEGLAHFERRCAAALAAFLCASCASPGGFYIIGKSEDFPMI